MPARKTESTPSRRQHPPAPSLVIVESPAKARTLAAILGPEYHITASVGHVRDLPRSKLGVDIEREFEPHYVVPREKADVVRRIKEAAAKAGTVYLATDPDREGEAISWHLVAAANLEGKPLRRVVFHELTPNAVREAFRHPRGIDQALVDAQQARRILDRLVGYKISPLLWRKVGKGLSAGRVQSAALRMVVDREREIMAFQPKEYWTLDALLAKAAGDGETEFTARLRGQRGKRHWEVGSAAEAERIAALLRGAAFRVGAVNRRDQHRRPAPPFTTSTLQQEASRRFGFTARRTMALAQQLYEGVDLPGEGRVGLITYMRTDSTHLAPEAVREVRAYVARRFGGDFLPAAPRHYRSRKGAQEAHEAIRPTAVGREPGSPALRGLTPDQRRLYTLIWQRAVACQMADAVLDAVTVDVEAAAADGSVFELRATASAVRFPGFRQLYEETTDAADSDAADQPAARLPELSAGDRLTLRDVRLEQHFTQPPPRYTEASLVKALEENGIGRPSTYAPTLAIIQDRGYVVREGRQLRPTELGLVVNDFLVEQFPNVVDLRFTAELEEDLDEVASGARPWRPTVRELYNPLAEALHSAAAAPVVAQETGESCPQCGRPLIRRFGRYGPFFACSGFPDCRYTRPATAAEAASGETCDLCGADMVVKGGRYGVFLACSRYPECKGSKPLLQKTGLPCPEDGGELVERRTKKGRRFYGCSNFPRCQFTSWQRPLQQACPRCAGFLVAERGRRARCLACGWKGAASAGRPRGGVAAAAGVGG